ncbi:hypothetical protein FRC08_001508 [Ceratobasidium sp. 394]|nr:hypothetical protein FRC08_001508 [Ceratobasidium sp. 394]
MAYWRAHQRVAERPTNGTRVGVEIPVGTFEPKAKPTAGALQSALATSQPSQGVESTAPSEHSGGRHTEGPGGQPQPATGSLMSGSRTESAT